MSEPTGEAQRDPVAPAESRLGPLPDPEGVWRAAASTRRLIDALVRRQVPTEEGHEVAAVLDELAHRLERREPRPMEMRLAPSGTPPGDPRWLDPYGLHDRNPTVGAANPIAPPADLRWEDGQVSGTVRFGSAYEGPPRLVYGGAIASLFDEAMGWVLVRAGRPALTAKLSVRFRAPTPLDTDLRIEAGASEWHATRVSVWGRLWAGDQLTADAEGVFIEPRRLSEIYPD